MNKLSMHVIVSIAGMVLLVGCAVGGGPLPPGAPSGGESGAPQRGGVFQKIGIRPLPHVSPWTQRDSANVGFYLTGGVFEQLMEYDHVPGGDWRTAKLVPELAERWERTDPVTYVFHIRKGVKWHDGEPFTARDVVWSLEYMRDPANKVLYIPNLSKILESVTLVDDSTVQIKLHQQDVEFLDKLTGGSRVSILPKHAYDRGVDFEKTAVGTGPFKIESYDPNGGVVYSANRDYWKPGMPYLDRWKMLPPADEAGRTAAFFAGQNDVLKVLARTQAEAIVGRIADAKLTPYYQDLNIGLMVKLDRPPFNDRRVREAVHLALDRQGMIATLTGGDGLMNPPGINPIYKQWAIPVSELEKLPGWRQPKEQDLARAKELLAEAGHRSGLSFTIKVDRNNPNWLPVSEVIAEQLRTLGVQVRLQPMESAVYNRERLDGDYQAYVASGGEVRNWPVEFYSSGADNTFGLRDPALDRLIESQTREFDEQKRAQIIQEVQRLLLREMYSVPTITFPGYLLQQSWVNGWVDNQRANVSNEDWGQVWLDKSKTPANR